MHMIVWFVILTSLVTGFQTLYDYPEEHAYMLVDGQQLMISTYITPAEEYQRRNIVMQEHDYSCGSAALATLLNYHLGEKFTETQVIHGLMTYGDVESIQKRRAFSLLDMKRFVDALGYHGAGYRAEMENLMEFDVPVVLPIEIWGYKHFVVFQGIHNNRVFLADPWIGHTSYPVKVFEDMWYRQVIFMAEPEGRTTRNLLALSRDDMRYIDEDMVLWTLFPFEGTMHIGFSRERESIRHLDPDAAIYQR